MLINNHSLIITNLIVLTINTYYFDKGTPTDPFFFCYEMGRSTEKDVFIYSIYTAGNRHKQNSWFCKKFVRITSGFGGGEFTKTHVNN